MTTPNLTAQADVALDPMAGTLAHRAEVLAVACGGYAVTDTDTYARALPGPDEWTDDNSVPLDIDPWAQDGAQTSTIKPEARASAGSGAAPSVGPAAYTLTLPYPISANRYWASRTVTPRGKPSFTTTYVTPEAKAYKAQVQKLALVAGVRKPIAGRVRVDFTLYPNRPLDWQKRMRKDGAAWDDSVMCLDLDNAQKVVLDSLKDVVFQDDAWVREIRARRAEPDEFGARLMVVVTPLAVAQPQTDLFAQERKA
jgi:Holliday junction resolvase RusA-like endonuclease